MIEKIGEIIRNRVKSDGRTAKIICAEMEMSRGNLDKIYHKESLSTDLLAQFSTVLNYDFFEHVNPFRNGDLLPERGVIPLGKVQKEITLKAVSREVESFSDQLIIAEKELEYAKENLSIARSSLQDKEEIIQLQKEKILQMENNIHHQREEIQNLRKMLDSLHQNTEK